MEKCPPGPITSIPGQLYLNPWGGVFAGSSYWLRPRGPCTGRSDKMTIRGKLPQSASGNDRLVARKNQAPKKNRARPATQM